MTPLRIAHRGASGSAPENTLAALETAIQMDVDLIEVDVRSTADGRLVLLHDAGIARTTDGVGELNRLSFETVRRQDAGSWFGREFAAERIPSLEEAIDLTRGRSLLLLEVKDPKIEEPLLDCLRRMDAMDGVVCQSFSSETVFRLKQAAPRLPCGLLLSSVPDSPEAAHPGRAVAEAVLSRGAQIAALSGRIITADLVQYLKRHGIPVWVWTLNEPDHFRQAIEMGIEGIITDHPERLGRQ